MLLPAAVSVCPGAALGQDTSPAASPTPLAVDQAVADLDPLSRSIRRVELGLRLDAEQTSLFWLPESGGGTGAGSDGPSGDGRASGRYYRVGPGFVARSDRLEYLVPAEIQDGEVRRWEMNITPVYDGLFIELPGPNTVFVLSPEPAASAAGNPVGRGRWALPGPDHRSSADGGPVAPGGGDEQSADARLDSRIEARIDGRVE